MEEVHFFYQCIPVCGMIAVAKNIQFAWNLEIICIVFGAHYLNNADVGMHKIISIYIPANGGKYFKVSFDMISESKI